MKLQDIKNIGLPKWPQMLVTGKSISNIDQIIDILIKTDSFFTDISEYSGGNNKAYNKWYRDLSGISEYLEPPFSEDWQLQWETSDKLRKTLGFVNTEYVHNSWASCTFIYGGHGWCSPEGIIKYVDNVGKWPSSEEIYNDWKKLAKAFPYIELDVTLLSGEFCEDNKEPLFNLKVSKGKVKVLPPDTSVHKETKRDDRINFESIWDSRNENCVPTHIVVQIGEKVKETLDKTRQEQ